MVVRSCMIHYSLVLNYKYHHTYFIDTNRNDQVRGDTPINDYA